MKKLAFFTTSMGKMRFMVLSKMFVFIVKKGFLFFLKRYYAFFLALVWPTLKKEKFGIFFYLKHGLTLSEKCNVWEFEKFCFGREKKFVFFLRHC